jgi:isopentenyl diphosphate isomerase/L-lactate dehydrogenase-like FMN-dependent dehydrogenase
MNRREAFQGLMGFMAASPLAMAQSPQLDIPYSRERVVPLEDLVNVFEFEPICKMRLPRQNYDYIAGGVDNEWSLRHNREAFDKITFRPRMLVNTSNLDLSLTLFGDKFATPIFIAPTAGHGMAHSEGELATARAAASVQALHILSTNSTQPYEKVAQATNFPKWFQLYPGPDLEGTWERVARAKGAGFRALALTVDAPYNSHRERLLLDRAAPLRLGSINEANEIAPRRRRPDEEPPATVDRAKLYGISGSIVHTLDWSFFDELKKRWGGPVLIKGILTAEDGDLAVKHGADGVIVSNHGGRYLEYAPATIEVLPEIVGTIGGKIPVLIDSGFRRGTDVLKALALGAKAVCVGRPPLWGLGSYGEPGVKRVLELLRAELALAMGLCGKANLAAIDKSVLRM